MGGDTRKGDSRRAERQSRSDDDEAHRLVEDHRLQRRKPKRADQQRQPKFRTAQADQAAKRADNRAAAEGRRTCCVLRPFLADQHRRG